PGRRTPAAKPPSPRPPAVARPPAALAPQRTSNRTEAGNHREGMNWTHIAFTPDGERLIVGGFPYPPMLWDVRTHRRVATLGDDGIDDFTVSPDGREVVLNTCHGGLEVWDTGSGRPIGVLEGCPSVGAFAFSP